MAATQDVTAVLGGEHRRQTGQFQNDPDRAGTIDQDQVTTAIPDRALRAQQLSQRAGIHENHTGKIHPDTMAGPVRQRLKRHSKPPGSVRIEPSGHAHLMPPGARLNTNTNSHHAPPMK